MYRKAPPTIRRSEFREAARLVIIECLLVNYLISQIGHELNRTLAKLEKLTERKVAII